MALIIVLVVSLQGPPQATVPPTQPVSGGPGPATGPVVATANPAGTAPAGTKPVVAEVKPAVADTRPETPGTEPGDRKPGRKDRGDKAPKGRDVKGSDRPEKTPGVTPPTQPARVETAPPAATPKPKAPKAKDDLDALLDNASSGSGGKPRAEAAKKDAPEQLSTDMIKSGLKSISGSAQACGTPGTYMVKLTIASSGRVSDASVPGKSGDAGADCVSKAVKGARFPEFTGSPQTLTYPIIVR